MKIQMVKLRGGVLAPASDIDEEVMTRFKTNEQYEIEIKQSRNPKFHAKVFKFLTYCFNHWKSDREFMDEAGQFDVFRKNLTVIAGYKREYYSIRGAVRVEAMSLSYANMDQVAFEQLYNALISAAMRTIFEGCDESVELELYNFF